jgi:CTP:molybdopterin cytidylyltransferase MocA
MNKKISLLLLAAGKSSRMGVPKGLLHYEDKYWIEEQIDRFEGVGDNIIIGLGADYQLYFDALPWLQLASENTMIRNGIGIRILINPEPDRGPFSTLLLLLSQCENAHKMFIQPIDVPLADHNSLKKMLQPDKALVLPRYKNKNGHPALISAKFSMQLLDIPLNDPAARLDRQIESLSASEKSLVDVSNYQIGLNLNQPEDWYNYLETRNIKPKVF